MNSTDFKSWDMNVLPKSDGNKIRFSGKYLDLDEKGCAVPTTSPQQVGHASRNSTAQYNFELTSLQLLEGLHYPKLVKNIRKGKTNGR